MNDRQNIRHLLLPTGRTVHRGTLLGLAEQRRVRVCAPEVLAGVRQLETPAEGVAAVELHPALIVQAVLVLDLISDHGVVPGLREVNSNSVHSSKLMMSARSRPDIPELSLHLHFTLS